MNIASVLRVGEVTGMSQLPSYIDLSVPMRVLLFALQQP